MLKLLPQVIITSSESVRLYPLSGCFSTCVRRFFLAGGSHLITFPLIFIAAERAEKELGDKSTQLGHIATGAAKANSLFSKTDKSLPSVLMMSVDW